MERYSGRPLRVPALVPMQLHVLLPVVVVLVLVICLVALIVGVFAGRVIAAVSTLKAVSRVVIHAIPRHVRLFLAAKELYIGFGFLGEIAKRTAI